MPSSLMPAATLDHHLAHMHFDLRRGGGARLPVELWDTIFEDCLPVPSELSLIHAPLNISQVCLRWRDIALSNPVLWSALAITTTRRHSESRSALEALHRTIQLWLLRSATRPLSVSLTQTESVRPISLLLDAILSHAAHLRSLEVCGPEVSLSPLQSPALYLPVLENLKIRSPSPRLAPPDLVIPLDRAPRLRGLTLLHASFDVAHVGAFDYTQLTNLDLLPDVHAAPHVFWTADEALAFLTDAPRLKSLRLAINDFMPRRRTLAQATALLSLSLEFRNALAGASRRSARIGAFFSLLYTPNLQHLSLRDRGAARHIVLPLSQSLDAWPQAQFLAYLGATSLRALHLEHLPLYETQVIECLRQVPLVTELVLEAPAHRGSQRNVGDILLEALTRSKVPPDGAPIAAALRSVEFRHCGKRCTEQALISMVDSRAGALQYLRVHRSALPSPELVKRVANWNMVVDVHY